MTSTYFVGSRLVAISPRVFPWSDGTLSKCSICFVCPTCGEVWGRVIVDSKEWLPLRRGCIKHPWAGVEGGTFIPYGMVRMDWIPEDLLKYELNLRLRSYDGNDTSNT